MEANVIMLFVMFSVNHTILKHEFQKEQSGGGKKTQKLKAS